jgi:hypothetical protein
VADAPWRCSQCGTVNEPVANACRTCGRWPSLFDLEASTIPSDEPATYDEADEYAAQTAELETTEPEIYDAASETTETYKESAETYGETEQAEEAAPPKPLWQRFASFIVPIGIVLYIIISALVNNDAS